MYKRIKSCGQCENFEGEKMTGLGGCSFSPEVKTVNDNANKCKHFKKIKKEK